MSRASWLCRVCGTSNPTRLLALDPRCRWCATPTSIVWSRP